MLINTFIHIPSISETKELMFWENGILSWDDFLKGPNKVKLPPKSSERITNFVSLSKEQLKNFNHDFFLSLLKPNEHWRAYKEFESRCCFLDIETTGLSKTQNRITTIGIYNPSEGSKVFINGKNLEEFQRELDKYSMIVTFNGSCFDLPFIKAKYPEVDFNKFHIDLRFVMRKLNFSGGLKNIEREIGIVRDDSLAEVDGREAVRLWKKYEKGDTEALNTLVRYNIEDIENLKQLMDFAYLKLRKERIGE